MKSKNMTLLKDAVVTALDRLYEKDYYLIFNRPMGSRHDCHVSERGIVFRFGIYLQTSLNDLSFNEYNIDVEYNRNMYEKKMLPSYANGTFPDLILHKRGSNEHNIMILEFKTWWNNDTTDDKKKINQFMDLNGAYRYRLGASIVLDKEGYSINWFD